jgi:hypothetical protein
MIVKSLQLAVLILCLASIGQAACHVVTPAGSGTNSGADWSNAFAGLPATLTRGDSYYLADGSYSPYTFNTAESGSTLVTILKAVSADHCTNTGFVLGTMGSATATFTTGTGGFALSISRDFLIVEGQTGTGKAAHGIHLVSSSTTDGAGAIGVTARGANLTFNHIEAENAPALNSNGSRVYYSVSTINNNVTFQNDYFHGGRVWIGFVAGGTSGHLIDHCYFANAGSGDPALHSAGLTLAQVSTVTVRYSVFENMLGGSNTTYIEPQFATSNVSIYGNVFNATSTNELTGQGIFAITSTDVTTNAIIYNNTIYGLHNFSGIWCGNVSGSTVHIHNNIWQNTVNPGFNLCSDVGNDNMLNTGAASFANPMSGDFHLTADTVAGTTFASPFATDPDAVTRGVDGTWDLGAYQLPSSSAAPAVTFAPISLSFGGVTVSVASPTQISAMTNTGTASLTISSKTITGTNASDFGETDNCPGTLTAGATCTFTVTFTPSATGTRTANVSVADNATGTPHVIPLSGTGVGVGSSISSLIQKRECEVLASASSITCTYSGATVSGDFLAAVVKVGANNAITSCSDSVNAGNWLKAWEIDDAVGRVLALYYKENVGVGTPTVTCAFAASINTALDIFEYKGLATSGSIDCNPAAASFTSQTPVSANCITTSANDVMIGAFTISVAATTTVTTEGTSFTTEDNDTFGTASHTHVHIADRIAGSIGTYSYGPTLSASDTGDIGIAAFKPPAALPNTTAQGNVQTNTLNLFNVPVRGTLTIGDQGVAQTGANIALTSGWSTSTVGTVSGFSQFERWIVTVAGTPAASPVITVTFPTAFPTAPICQYEQEGGTFGVVTNPAITSTTTTATITFSGTPVAAQTYTMSLICGL